MNFPFGPAAEEALVVVLPMDLSEPVSLPPGLIKLEGGLALHDNTRKV